MVKMFGHYFGISVLIPALLLLVSCFDLFRVPDNSNESKFPGYLPGSSYGATKPPGLITFTTLTYPVATGLEKVRPGQKGIPLVVTWNGKLYAARNLAVGTTAPNRELNNGAELWKCASSCTTAASWKKVATASSFTPNGANLRAISLLQVNGSYLYIGFDNVTNGAQVYRTTNSSITEIDSGSNCGDGIADNGDGHLCFQQQGTTGLGFPSENLYFFSSTSINMGSTNYIYANVGDANLAASRVYRQMD